MAALDKKLREQTRFELIDLQSKLGTTFVIVTHDQEEAMTVADRIAVMDQGRLIQVAPPAEIYEQPASRYVAGFIGNVNLIEAKVIAREGAGLRLQSEMIRCPIRAAQTSDAKIGDPVTLALRPEKVKIGLERPADAAENCIEGVVWDIAYLGDLSIYRVRLENGVLLMAAKPNLARLEERPISWDDRVFLSWVPDAGVVLTR
jgi:putrescine transport system ATP-binding protein